MSDLISRKAAIDFIDAGRLCNPNEPRWSDNEVVNFLKTRPSAQQWIPVSERLPKYKIQVLTIDKDGDYELNHIVDEEDGEWYWGHPIAWMPLPKPYQKEGD